MSKAYTATIVVISLLCALVVWAADEIRVTPELQLANGLLKLTRDPGTITLDQRGEDASDLTQTFSTDATSAVVVAAGVATNGICWFRNLTTNEDRYIDLGTLIVATSNWQPTIRLRAQEVFVGRLHPTNALYGLPTGGDVKVRCIVIED